MAEMIKRNKALSVSPLKASSPIGAALAFLGINRSIPMLHGSQGCTAFGKVFFVRHFREPIPLQTTAMDQVSSVMGADGNIVEGLKTICEKSKPALIGLPSTGLAETQGCDLRGSVKKFRDTYPEYAEVKVVPVNTPDFTGCLESGYAAAVHAMIDVLVPSADEAGTKPGQRRHQVNVLVNASLTPGDLETLREIIGSFGLRPILIPDVSDSLDGHLTDQDFSPVTIGGTPVSEFDILGDSIATLAIGPSLFKAGELLQERTGVPLHTFDHLMGLEAMDVFVMCLHEISGAPVPESLARQRAQLQDCMLDTHFMLGQARFAIAGDSDLLLAMSSFVTSMGAEVVAAVVPARSDCLKQIPCQDVKIGDLEDLEKTARERKAEILIGNSHAVDSAMRLNIPILRAGFPQYDLLGGYQRSWIGYRSSRQALFDLANILLEHNTHEIHPYHSTLAQKIDAREAVA
ncbi:MAG: nitrogenase iron-molybdenum cofactor biosynthesis protein NifN [Gammaproteobacteria bacterium]|nr:nitrogenase iron-molybdenum cofactor biosynthesis protein NifN [Gammaproteobacteria bacterium]